MIRIAAILLGSLMFATLLLPVTGHASVSNGPPFLGTEHAPAKRPALEQLAGSFEIIINNKKLKLRGCPAGQNRDPNTGVCFSCSHNDHFENGKCVPNKNKNKNKKKDVNKNKNEKQKKKLNACPQGTELREGQCQKSEFPEIEECPDGQNLDPNTGVCFSCSHNDHFENGKCVPCKEGFHVEGDQCVAD